MEDPILFALFSIIFVTGWTCSIIGLWKLKATGDSKFGRGILIIQLILLMLANCFNVYEAFALKKDTFFFYF